MKVNTIGMEKKTAEAILSMQKDTLKIENNIKQNSTDITLAPNSGLKLFKQQLTLGIPTVVTTESSDTVTGNTHTHSLGANPTFTNVNCNILITNKITPPFDSTTALQITKADGATSVLILDSTNNLINVNAIKIDTYTLNTNEWSALDNIDSAWTSFTPSWSNLVVGNGTNVGYYKKIGKLVVAHVSLTFGNSTSISAGATLVLPLTISSNYTTASSHIGEGYIVDASASTPYSLKIRQSGILIGLGVTGTYVTEYGITNTAPITFTTSDRLEISLTYESA
jgi:hypothetical protein